VLPAGLRVLSSGIDSLYASAQGVVHEGLLEVFQNMRELCPGEALPFEFRPGEGYFLLRPHGWRGYPFWLSSPAWEIMVGAASPFPPLYVQLHAWFLHTVGPEGAIAETAGLLHREFFAGAVQLVASRIDIYADVQGWSPTAADFDGFVCRGVRRRLYVEPQPQQRHGVGRKLSGFTFGKGHVVARLYDKTLELASRGEDWPTVLWGERDADAPVWRIEFQFRREALQAVRIRTVEEAITLRQSLWEYGMRWLSLRAPSDHAKPSRWPEADVWAALRATRMGAAAEPLIRERRRGADQRRLVSGFLGYTSSLAAMAPAPGPSDVKGAVQRALPLGERYLRERGLDFAAIVAKKRAMRRALRYGDACHEVPGT
jgi:hypothetical protein